MNQTGGSYSVINDTVTYKVKIGVTTVSNVARTFTIGVNSNTGAVQGTQYSLNKTTVTFPAGKVIDSVIVKGVFAQYQTSGRKDTIKLFFTGAKTSISTYNDTFKLFMRGPCFEGDVTLSSFLGTYARTTETFGTGAPYGPYTTTVTAVNQLTPTTGTITVANIWDSGWGPLTFTLDWTNPNSRTATVTANTGISGSNAGDLNATYAGIPIAVRPFAGQPGTFSACNGTLTLRMQLGVGSTNGTVVGYFGSLYTVNLVR